MELSTFQPTPDHEPGGIKRLHPDDMIVPVHGDTSIVSEQARLAHLWLMQRYSSQRCPNTPVSFLEIQGALAITRQTVTAGDDKGHYTFHFNSLDAFPIEELIDASLAYVAAPEVVR